MYMYVRELRVMFALTVHTSTNELDPGFGPFVTISDVTNLPNCLISKANWEILQGSTPSSESSTAETNENHSVIPTQS